MVNKNISLASQLRYYADIVGESTIDELKLLASYLKGKKVQHISSKRCDSNITGVLASLTPLMRELDIDIEWDIIDETSEFFKVNRRLNNAIGGKGITVVDRDFDSYLDSAHEYLATTKIKGDIVFVHDLQPIVLIQNKKRFKATRWVWYCHSDLSSPDERVWDFISTFIEGYDASVFSSPKFIPPLKIPRFIISPAIDPLNNRNKDLSMPEIDKVLHKYGIDKARPIISQVSPFDSSKDPLGVIEAFMIVKRYIDAQLVLAGSPSGYDPDSERLFEEAKDISKGAYDIHILPIEDNDIEINALQRVSSVIVQKSIKEGFGLTVAEALWKAKPVVASAIGGIPLQMRHKYSGLLCHSIDGAAMQIRQLLNNPEYAKRLAENGKEHIRRNFLITQLIKEEMLLILALFHEGDIITL